MLAEEEEKGDRGRKRKLEAMQDEDESRLFSGRQLPDRLSGQDFITSFHCALKLGRVIGSDGDYCQKISTFFPFVCILCSLVVVV